MGTAQKQPGSFGAQNSIGSHLLGGRTPTRQLVHHLQRVVANGFVLYMNYKHYHWQTDAPAFRGLHLVFAEFAEEVVESVDRLVQRIQTVSPDVPAHLLEVIELARVAVASPHRTMRETFEEADRNLAVAIRELREAARIADQQHDHGTLALASMLAGIYERHKAWLRDILNKREGPQLV
jgi:starvation-inducible DNA-binding protein